MKYEVKQKGQLFEGPVLQQRKRRRWPSGYQGKASLGSLKLLALNGCLALAGVLLFSKTSWAGEKGTGSSHSPTGRERSL